MCELNKRIEQTRYPLPKLKDIFERHRNYKYFAEINISMQYYSFLLYDESSSTMCVIVTPFGKYHRNPCRSCLFVVHRIEDAMTSREEILNRECNFEILHSTSTSHHTGTAGTAHTSHHSTRFSRPTTTRTIIRRLLSTSRKKPAKKETKNLIRNTEKV
jgi:hypothetical protein